MLAEISKYQNVMCPLLTWEVCVLTGIVQETQWPHWPARWGEVWRWGQGAEGRQGGKCSPTASQQQQLHEPRQTKELSPHRLKTWGSKWSTWQAWRSPLWRKCVCQPTPCWKLCWAPSTQSTWTWGPTWSRSRRRTKRRWVLWILLCSFWRWDFRVASELVLSSFYTNTSIGPKVSGLFQRVTALIRILGLLSANTVDVVKIIPQIESDILAVPICHN